MANVDALNFTSEELTSEKLKELICNKQSFKVVAVKSMSHIVNKIEGAIEKENLKCRVYTENRSALMAGFVPNPLSVFTAPIAAASAICSAVHNIAAYDPDYEIGKNVPFSSITVVYKKS